MPRHVLKLPRRPVLRFGGLLLLHLYDGYRRDGMGGATAYATHFTRLIRTACPAGKISASAGSTGCTSTCATDHAHIFLDSAIPHSRRFFLFDEPPATLAPLRPVARRRARVRIINLCAPRTLPCTPLTYASFLFFFFCSLRRQHVQRGGCWWLHGLPVEQPVGPRCVDVHLQRRLRDERQRQLALLPWYVYSSKSSCARLALIL